MTTDEVNAMLRAESTKLMLDTKRVASKQKGAGWTTTNRPNRPRFPGKIKGLWKVNDRW